MLDYDGENTVEDFKKFIESVRTSDESSDAKEEL